MFAKIYDGVLACFESLGLGPWRARLAARARGRVLEIGAGTGLNLRYLREATSVVLTEPDRQMLARASARAARIRCPVSYVAARAEALPFAAGSFDTVVATLVFCTVSRPEDAFREVRRVLRPSGRLLLLEHVRTPRMWMARVQDLATPFWKRLARGCHLNRPSLELAIAGGFLPTATRHGLDGWLVSAELKLEEERPGTRRPSPPP